MEKEPQKALERRWVRENSRIPVKAKTCAIRALSIMNSYILIERIDVWDEVDSFLTDDVWGTSGSHMWEENTKQ